VVRTYAGRSERRDKLDSARLKAMSAEQQRPCILCGQPIDYTLPADHPQSFTKEHVIPLSIRPDLAQDPTNYAPAHASCNKSAGNRERRPPVGDTSEQW
jgi:HNH endonuclease